MQQLNPLRVSCPTCKQPEGWACGYVPVGTSHFNRIAAAVQDEFEEDKAPLVSFPGAAAIATLLMET